MGIFKRPDLSPEQIERVRQSLARGRKSFIIRRGIVGFGVPAFALATLWNWYDHYGWHLPPAREMLLLGGVDVLIWSVAGYAFGALMWNYLTGLVSERK